MANNNLNAQEWVEHYSKITDYNILLMLQAAMNENRADVLKLLIPKAKEYDSILSFFVNLAITQTRIDVMNLLLANGLDINKKINEKINEMETSSTLLHIAASGGFLEAVKWLLDNGAEIDARDEPNNSTPMHYAAQLGRIDVIRFLKERGADIYARNSGDNSPMDIAASISNKTESIKCLKELGADVNVKDKYGETAIHKAAMFGKTESIKCLKELGADVNAKNNDGETPMFSAVKNYQVENIKYLAALGADVNAKNNEGNSILFLATLGEEDTEDKTECIKCLAALGADVNAKNNGGLTPIFGAVASGLISTLKCLKELGANMSVESNKGVTPLNFAVNLGDTKAAEWLRANAKHLENLPVCGETKAAEWLRANAEKERAEKERVEREKAEKKRVKREKRERRKKTIHVIGRVSAIVFAVLSSIMMFVNYSQGSDGSGFIVLIFFIIPFLVIFFSDEENWILKSIFLCVGIALSILTLLIAKDNLDAETNAAEVPFFVAMSIGFILSYVTAMIFPKD
jgi:ankyrin repeat protein/predicted membrane channel-forming protein YqfA (hemolysin III family)